MENAGLPAPEYTDNAFMLNVTIKNGVTNEVINDKNEVINEVINDTLGDNEQILFNVISADSNITKPGMKAQTNLSMSTIDRTIKSLKEKDILQRVGSNKAGHWIITR